MMNTSRQHRQNLAVTLVGLFVVGVALGIIVFFSRPSRSASGTSAVATPGAAVTVLASFDLSTPISAVATPIAGLEEGKPAPDFTLLTLDGEEVSLSDFRGRPVLINFWASWCPPCRLEMPDLVRAYETHQEEGFVILGINQAFQDNLVDAEAFVDEFHMTFPILLDLDGEVTNELYQLRGLPTSVFVDEFRMINRIYIGLMTGEQIDEYVAEILD